MIQRSDLSVCGAVCFAICGLLLPLGAMSKAAEAERRYELLAVDQSAGRAVMMDVAGATIVLELEEETLEGLRLRSVAGGAVLLDVRFKSSGDVIAYRIALGETVRIRPPAEHRSGGVRVIAVPLEVMPPEVRTGAKDPSSSAQDQ